jgi:hypothetical protein
MDFILFIITFISNILKKIQTFILNTVMQITSFFTEKKGTTKITWRDDLQDVYYTYSKEEYDRKSFKPFLFQRNFFK